VTGLSDYFLLGVIFVGSWCILRLAEREIALILGLGFDLTIPLQHSRKSYVPRTGLADDSHGQRSSQGATPAPYGTILAGLLCRYGYRNRLSTVRSPDHVYPGRLPQDYCVYSHVVRPGPQRNRSRSNHH
jgi:hypothetical protein